MSPVSPTAAATAYAKVPVSTPSIETSPARRPWSMLRVTRNSTAGPGITSRARLAPTNSSRVEASGMAAS